MKRPKKIWVAMLFVLFYVLHLLGVLGFVSHFEWGSGRPLLTDDYALRSSILYDTRVLFKTSGSLWGYSPYHLAGYPYGLFGISSKGEQVLSLLFPSVTPSELLKRYILIGIVIFPFLMMGAARVLKLSSSSIVIASIISILFFWKYPNVSSIRWGSISYIIACPLALLAVALFLRFRMDNTLRHFSLFCLFGSVALLVHAITLMVILPSIVSSLVDGARKKPRWVFLLGWLGLFGVVAANFSWIFPFLRYRSLLQATLSEPAFLENLSMGSWYLRKDMSRAFLLLLGLFGIWKWFREREGITLPLAFGITSLITIMFFLKRPTSLLFQRYRYDWPLSLLLSFPASAFIAEKYSQFFDLLNRKGRRPFSLDIQKASLLFFCGIIPLVLVTSDTSRYTLCLNRLFLKEKTFATSRPLPTSMRPLELDQLLAWIQKNKGQEGRLLMEDSHHPRHIYWETHFPAILPLLTGREVVASPLPESPIQVATIGLIDGKLFGKPIEQFSPSTFQDYVNSYNIRWIICFSPMAKQYFKNLPNTYIRKDASIGPFSCYEINRESNFFLKGKAFLKVGMNHFELSEVEPEGGEIILKYHWIENLKTVPSRHIERFSYRQDPFGFIRVVDPPERLEIKFQP